jgi:hypothetical protein
MSTPYSTVAVTNDTSVGAQHCTEVYDIGRHVRHDRNGIVTQEKAPTLYKKAMTQKNFRTKQPASVTPSPPTLYL